MAPYRRNYGYLRVPVSHWQVYIRTFSFRSGGLYASLPQDILPN